MNTSSHLEAYTTLFGWAGYNNWFNLIEGTGIWMIPLLVFILGNWFNAHKNGSVTKPAPIQALQAIEFDVYRSVIVMMFCFTPFITLSSGSVTYQDQRGNTSTPDKQAYGLNAGGLGKTPSTVSVPLWWYGVMKFSQGINWAGRAVMPDEAGIRRQLHALGGIHIQDQELRSEVDEFYSQCYLPALAKYQREKPTQPRPKNQTYLHHTLAKAYKAKYGEDVDWIGSQMFLGIPGYYRQCYDYEECGVGFEAGSPRPDWPFQWQNDQGPTPDWGRPRCQEWWEDPTYGLKPKLLQQAKDQGAGNILSDFELAWQSGTSNFIFDQTKRKKNEDLLIRKMIENSPGTITGMDFNEQAAQENAWDATLGAVKRGLSMIGTAITGGILAVAMDAVIQALPMIQAFILFFMFWSLPWGLLISGFSWETVVNYTFAFFTVYFWTTLWRLADWIDTKMIQYVYPGWDGWEAMFSNLATGKMLMLSLVTLTLYILFPVLWSKVMLLANRQVVGGLEKIAGEGGVGQAQQAGSKGAGVGQAGAKAAAKEMRDR